MYQAITEGQGTALGGLYILVFIALVVGFFVWADKKVMQPAARRRREKQIEAAMRLGMADAETQKRIARKIVDEYRD